jgi:hypothetical protein
MSIGKFFRESQLFHKAYDMVHQHDEVKNHLYKTSTTKGLSQELVFSGFLLILQVMETPPFWLAIH